MESKYKLVPSDRIAVHGTGSDHMTPKLPWGPFAYHGGHHLFGSFRQQYSPAFFLLTKFKKMGMVRREKEALYPSLHRFPNCGVQGKWELDSSLFFQSPTYIVNFYIFLLCINAPIFHGFSILLLSLQLGLSVSLLSFILIPCFFRFSAHLARSLSGEVTLTLAWF